MTTYTTTRQVEFAETDMAGIMHFANFYRWMENVEHEFFRSMGLSIHTKLDGQHIGWPRLESTCKFKRPLKFEEIVIIDLSIEEITQKTVTYKFDFKKELNGETLRVAQGQMTTVCATVEPSTGKLAAIPIPELIRDKLRPLNAPP